MTSKSKKLISLMVMMISVIMIGFPSINGTVSNLFEKQTFAAHEDWLSTLTTDEVANVVNKMNEYNEQIQPGGETIIDPFIVSSYDSGASLEDIRSRQVIGYIHLPSINVRLPLRLGASDENLSDGAAQISGTSMPTGGIGTRSVIAGHRGYRGQQLFKEIDSLQAGDKIYVYVLGNLLTYSVTSAEVISPSDTHKIAPVEGEDMLTLLSCEPFPRNHERYIVDSKRIPNEEVEAAGFVESSSLTDRMNQGDQSSTVSLSLRIKHYMHLLITFASPVVLVYLMYRFTVIIKEDK